MRRHVCRRIYTRPRKVSGSFPGAALRVLSEPLEEEPKSVSQQLQHLLHMWLDGEKTCQYVKMFGLHPETVGVEKT